MVLLKKRAAAFLSIVLMAAGCNAGFDKPFVPGVPDTVTPVVLKGSSVPDNGAKTSLGTPEGTKVPLVWNRADQIGMFLSASGTALTASDNASAMIVKDSGPGTREGTFAGTLTGLSASTTYDVKIYYPWYQSASSSGTSVYDRIHPHQTQTATGNSSHIGKSGGFAVGNTSFTTPASLDGFTAELDFSLTHKTAYVQFDVNAAAGDYTGWLLKRITMSAPDGTNIAGQCLWEPANDTFTLVNSDALSNTIVLDIEASDPLSATAQSAYMVVFPTAVNSKVLTFTYTLQTTDGSQTVNLTKTKTMSATSTLFSPGKIYRLQETLPATAGGEWTAENVVVDVEYYREKILGIAKRAGVPSINATYKDNLKEISVFVVNDDFYNTPGRSQEAAPITENSVYQAASVTKVTFNYIFWKMREQGYFNDLDQPVYELWPAMLDLFADDAKEDAKLITLRMIITHTTGLDGLLNYGSKFTFDAAANGYYPGGNKYRYSNKAISILGWTMEYLLGYEKGKGLRQMGRDYIFDKLGMTNTNFEWVDSYETLAVYGHNTAGTRWRNNNWSGGKANAAYSLRSNSKEYTKYLQWMMHGADLSPETLKEMLLPQFRVVAAKTNSTTESWRTLGWMCERCEELGPVYRHAGSLDGFRSEACMIPERNATFSCFVNFSLTYEVREAVFNLFVPHHDRFAWIELAAVPNTSGNAGVSDIIDE